MSALEKIIEWASTLPKWEDDIIRRLLTQSEFSEQDEQQAIDFLKSKNNLIKENNDIALPLRTGKVNISGIHQSGINISLKELKCVSG